MILIFVPQKMMTLLQRNDKAALRRAFSPETGIEAALQKTN